MINTREKWTDEMLRDMADIAIEQEWGTELQIEAENYVYNATAERFGINWEEHSYLSHATTPEAMAYVLKTCGINNR